jgi:septal ring factor EnvC (AmiA/AmiB activator)
MKIKLLLVTFASILVVTFGAGFALAQSGDFGVNLPMGGEDNESDFSNRLDDLEDKIKEYEEKINKLQQRGASLEKEIEYANSQISLTELKIQQTLAQIEKKQQEIVDLANDIDDLKTRIDKLINSIDFQEEVLGERMRARYKAVENSPVLMLFGSSTLNQLIQKSEYLKVMEMQDKKLLDEMGATKNAFGIQKNLVEDKKKEEELLKSQLEAEKANLDVYKADLDRQRKDKEKLLEETENDENNYQALLAQTQSELAALQLAINLPEGDGEEVDKGDVIGLMGNTGCSSGPHLHFGYVRDGRAVDPLPYLQSGKLKWPVDNWGITQYFGENYTFYMNNFGVPGHDAVDFISTSQYSGAPIRAAKDGKVYYATDSKVYCPWLNGSLGKGAIIDHGDGERTIYWHLQ